MRVAYGEFKAEKRAIVSILKHGDSINKSKVQTVIDFFDEERETDAERRKE